MTTPPRKSRKPPRTRLKCDEPNCSFWFYLKDKFDEHKELHRAEVRAKARREEQARQRRHDFIDKVVAEDDREQEIKNRASSAPPAVSLPQLLQEIGEDNLQWQLLSQCLHSGDTLKNGKGTKLQFITKEPLGSVALRGTRNAFIVWTDTERIGAAYQVALRKASLGGGPNSQEPAPNPPPPPEQPLVTATTALPVDADSVDDPSAATPVEEEAPKKAGPVPLEMVRPRDPMEYFDKYLEMAKTPTEPPILRKAMRDGFALVVEALDGPSAERAEPPPPSPMPELRFVGTSEVVQVVHTYSAGSEKPILTEHKPGGQYIVVTGEGVLRKGQELLVQLPPDVELVKKEPKVAAYPKQGPLLVAAGIDFDPTTIKAELVVLDPSASAEELAKSYTPSVFFTCEGCGRTGVSTKCKGQTKCTECLDIESGNSVSKLADLNGVPRQYYEGYCASRDTKARTENPYPPGEDHRLWNAGFDWAQSFHGLRAKIPQTNLFTVKIRLFGRPEDKPRDHLLVVAAFSEQDARVKAQVWRDSNKWYGSDLLRVGFTTNEELQGDYFKTDEAEPLIELREKWGLAPPKLSWQSCSAPIPYTDQKDIEGARMLMGRWDADTQRWFAIWEGTAERVEQDAQRLDFGAYKASTRAGTMYINPTHYILVDNLPKP